MFFGIISMILVNQHIVYALMIAGFFMIFFAITVSQMVNAISIRKNTLEIRELKELIKKWD